MPSVSNLTLSSNVTPFRIVTSESAVIDAPP
jgi:hypothetical protein